MLADLYGDGDLDLVVTNLLASGSGQSSRTRLYLNQFIESGSTAISFSAGIDISPDHQLSRSVETDEEMDLAISLNDTINNPPEFTSTPVEVAAEGEVYTYNVTATDLDIDTTVAITAAVQPASCHSFH